MRAGLCAFAFSSVVAALAPNMARADALEDFYRGKTMSLVVSSATGGGYDALSRIVAKHMVKHMPGAPNIVVRNMPGAGGVIATNHLYNVASRDGLTFGQLQNTLPFEPLLGNKEAMYDSSKFNCPASRRACSWCAPRRRSPPSPISRGRKSRSAPPASIPRPASTRACSPKPST